MASDLSFDGFKPKGDNRYFYGWLLQTQPDKFLRGSSPEGRWQNHLVRCISYLQSTLSYSLVGQFGDDELAFQYVPDLPPKGDFLLVETHFDADGSRCNFDVFGGIPIDEVVEISNSIEFDRPIALAPLNTDGTRAYYLILTPLLCLKNSHIRLCVQLKAGDCDATNEK
jgi:hypothetical protein